MRWLLLILLVLPFPARAQTWQGVPQVTDGDSLVMNGDRLRLNNMDAFEFKQPCWRVDGSEYQCGIEATNALIAIIGGREVTCQWVARDYYGRALVICRVNGVDLGQAMVRAGWAVAEFDPRDYAADQEYARANKLGAWVGTFQRPREWRKKNPR